jgi:hypothetical protein
MGPEAKLYQNVKQNFKSFSLIRIENISLLGTPDLLVCNTSGHFCTVEAKALGPLPPKTSPISMYHGSRIEELVTYGLKLDACYSGWDACRLAIEQVGSKA